MTYVTINDPTCTLRNSLILGATAATHNTVNRAPSQQLSDAAGGASAAGQPSNREDLSGAQQARDMPEDVAGMETDVSFIRVLPPRKGRPKEPLKDVSGVNRIFELEVSLESPFSTVQRCRPVALVTTLTCDFSGNSVLGNSGFEPGCWLLDTCLIFCP